MYCIRIDKINLLFKKIADNQTLYLPVDTVNGSKYEKWNENSVLSKSLNTVRSPKDFFFPQTENIVNFKLEGKNIEIIDPRKETEDFVIFGVRACDVRAFDILDRVFLKDTPDTYYQNRREHSTVISLACTKPAESCFCTSFGIDATVPGGDLTAWMGDELLYLRENTEKGKKIVALLSDLIEECNSDEVEDQKRVTKDRLRKLPLSDVTTEGFTPEKTKELFSSTAWEELSESCLACGSCTFVCPTCQCYDIKDFDTGHGIERFRCWDSCMYSDFTKMSAGQPRTSQLERFRQRFMHKLIYFPENNEGLYSCVGCGRCLKRCPIHMNIVKVMKRLGGEINAK